MSGDEGGKKEKEKYKQPYTKTVKNIKTKKE